MYRFSYRNSAVIASRDTMDSAEVGVSRRLGKLDDNMTYSQRLFHHTYASQNEDAHLMEFRLLQRLNLVQLQNELARIKGKVWRNLEASEEDMKDLRVKLRDYGTWILCYVLALVLRIWVFARVLDVTDGACVAQIP